MAKLGDQSGNFVKIGGTLILECCSSFGIVSEFTWFLGLKPHPPIKCFQLATIFSNMLMYGNVYFVFQIVCTVSPLFSKLVEKKRGCNIIWTLTSVNENNNYYIELVSWWWTVFERFVCSTCSKLNLHFCNLLRQWYKINCCCTCDCNYIEKVPSKRLYVITVKSLLVHALE